MSEPFISYAQNFEDVMLWRALKNEQPGFYVDVGANDPVADSVTKAFYDRGWRGVNIEVVTEFWEKLCRERPEDSNIQIFVGSTDGMIPFHEIPETGLSTSQLDIAERHRAAGFQIKSTEVRSCTLNSILNQSNVKNESFHFLKVDVEGGEAEVFQGLDLERYRPWILVVEATEPMSTKPSYQEFERLILPHGYRFIYFDGLSRFYVAKERAALIKSFETPPNVFDGFMLWSAFKAGRDLAEVGAGLAERESNLAEAQADLEAARAELATIKNRSKRLTQHLKEYHQRVKNGVKGLTSATKELYSSRAWKWGSFMVHPLRRSGERRQEGLDKISVALGEVVKEFDLLVGSGASSKTDGKKIQGSISSASNHQLAENGMK